ncbi:uncharacterized protein PG998_006388 [Apiospora kogelbergensis]|uniref:DUF952 domain-containing protein n=1 Tax=Apiospora kogelbergensis TaxID=1337665 RepID=A0AAW0R521_9PEZI
MATQEQQQPTKVFKILGVAEWQAWQDSGSFRGASIDLTDGYIHLSTAAQSKETFEKYFAGQTGLVVAEVDLDKVADPVRWEASRGGALFPHVYGGIPRTAVARVFEEVNGELFDRLLAEQS